MKQFDNVCKVLHPPEIRSQSLAFHEICRVNVEAKFRVVTYEATTCVAVDAGCSWRGKK